MSKPTLLFVTTSLGTKWESYSQALIARGYPESKRIVIDGTTNWSPLMFLQTALEEESDYTVHVDEDCFLYDPAQLGALIEKMEARQDIVLAGTPDGGHYYREHNPYACNLFFMVFKTDRIRSLMLQNPQWESYRFSTDFKKGSELDLSFVNLHGVKYDDFEPYYGFFWMILKGSDKILYLRNGLNPEFLSTDLHFTNGKIPLARHMWYLRDWHREELGPHDKIPNRNRYLMVEKEILKLFGGEPGFMRTLSSLNRKRMIRQGSRRVQRLMGRLGFNAKERIA
jgi:hypothetical protein